MVLDKVDIDDMVYGRALRGHPSCMRCSSGCFAVLHTRLSLIFWQIFIVKTLQRDLSLLSVETVEEARKVSGKS